MLFLMPCRLRAVVIGVASFAWAGCKQNADGESVVASSDPVVARQETERRTPEDRLSRKNIVLVTIDTLRADHLGCYGYARATSPSIDALAADGILFKNALAQWPKTTPSFASMLTGLYPHSNGIERACGLIVDSRFTLLAERLRDAGYRTIGVVTNPNLGREFGFDQGFESYFEVFKGDKAPKEAHLPGPSSNSRRVSELALWELSKIDRAEPVFLWVHYTDPHAPYSPPDVYKQRFVGDKWFDEVSVAPFLSPEHDRDYNAIGGINSHVRIGDEQRIGYYVAQYDAAIFTVDEQINQLLKRMRDDGWLDDAMVALTADHGEGLGDHGLFFEHGPLPYNDCAHVPFVLHLPGLSARQVIEEPVAMLDLVPTMLDWLGFEPDPALEGRSLLPLLRGEDVQSQPVFMGSGYSKNYQRTVRMGKWKLIHVPDPADRENMTGSEFELYDIDADPGELRNLAAEQPKIVAAMEQALMNWVEAGKAKAAGEALAPTKLDPETERMLRALGYLRD